MKKNKIHFSWVIILIAIILLTTYFIIKLPTESDTTTTTTIQTIPIFDEYDQKQGWYYGNINQRKPSTPEHWLHAREGSRSAMWFNPITGNESICVAISRASESIEKGIEKFCTSNDDCESMGYVDSLTNAVKCFSKKAPNLPDYEYAFYLYRELDCPLNMGGAPYSKAYCECIEGNCKAILIP